MSCKDCEDRLPHLSEVIGLERDRRIQLEATNAKLRDALGISLNEYASFLQTMTAINEHQGYKFTQVLSCARGNLYTMQDNYEALQSAAQEA